MRAPYDFHASERQYVDHLTPIWKRLLNAERGRFTVPHQLLEHARDRGVVDAIVGVPVRRSPVPLVVAAVQDSYHDRTRPIVFVEHGAGQTYDSRHTAYSGGPDRDHVRLFLCPSRAVADRNRAAYPATPAIVIGCPKLDELPEFIATEPPTVAISFHWNCGVTAESRWAYPHFRSALEQVPDGLTVLGHGHPRVFNWLAPYYEHAGIEPVRDFEEIRRRAEVYVCDNSSTIFEFAAGGRPVVLMNSPGYRREVSVGLRFWEFADVGLNVESPQDLWSTVFEALIDTPALARRRAEVSRSVYGELDGQAALRGVQAIREA